MPKLANIEYLYTDVAVLVFCKAPVPGHVKTRLTTAISAEAAADIHQLLTRRTLALVRAVLLCPIQLWCSPDTEHPFFQNCVDDYGVSLHRQRGADLGERMHAGFQLALQSYKQVILLGCDCPSLTTEDLISAIKALKNGHDVVLAPAEDGGYTLIGLNQAQAELFSDIEWGSSSVLANTRTKITSLGLKRLELAEQWDVDTPEDLARYYAMESSAK